MIFPLQALFHWGSLTDNSSHTEKAKLIVSDVTVETIEVTEKQKGNRMANISKDLRGYER